MLPLTLVDEAIIQTISCDGMYVVVARCVATDGLLRGNSKNVTAMYGILMVDMFLVLDCWIMVAD